MKNSFTITNDIYLKVENRGFLISYLEDSLTRIMNNDVPFPIDYFAIIYENFIDSIPTHYEEIVNAFSDYIDDIEYEKYSYGEEGLAYKDFLMECINNKTFRQTYFN